MYLKWSIILKMFPSCFNALRGLRFLTLPLFILFNISPVKTIHLISDTAANKGRKQPNQLKVFFLFCL